MLLQAGGRANALRALIKSEQERAPDFMRLANALTALYPPGSDEKRVLDAMLAAHPELREEYEATFKLRRDPRVTRVGRILRITGLDELPQLFSVLTGKMVRRDDQLMIGAELVNVADGTRLWGEQYSRKLTEVLAVQAEIVKQIS